MIAIVLAVPGAAGDRLALDAYDAGHELAARADTAARLHELLPEVGVAIVAVELLDPKLLSAADEHGVRLVVLHLDDAGRRRAAAIGVLDSIDVGSPWVEVERLALSAQRARSEAPSRGRVTVVWGPAGAPGRSTVAAAIAAELAARGRSVALVDADSYGGTLAPALGLLDESPGFAAACRLAGVEALTVDELERVAQRTGSPPYRVLTGIARGRRWPELTTERVGAVIAACAGWVEEVVIDVGFNLELDEEIMSDLFAPRRNAATLTVLQSADRIIAVAAAEPVGLARFLRAQEDLVEIVSDTPISIVLNRVRASAVGPSPAAQATAALGRFGGMEPAASLPFDLAALDAALLAGSDVRSVAPRSAFARAVAALVTSVLLPEQPAPRRRRRRATRRLWPQRA